MRARGLEVESQTYPGAPHSYFDRSFGEHRAASQDSWRQVLDFTDRHPRTARGGCKSICDPEITVDFAIPI